MVAAKETAEEQLLRMIEGPGKSPASPRGPWHHAMLQQLAGRFSIGVEALRRLAFPLSTHQDGGDMLLSRLRFAERIVWVLLGGLGVYLIVDLFLVQLKPPTLTLHASLPEATLPGPSMVTDEQLKPLADYKQAVVSRNPFALAAKSLGEAVASSKSKLQELTATLSVVGINRGRVPEALIEDAAAKRTYVVKVGDELNGLTVKTIDQRGVTVSYENEETLIP